MEELKAIFSQTDKKELVNQLINSNYAFASWRMPETSEIVLIVSLTEASQSNNQFNDLSRGFVFNRFKDSHPIQPYHIQADLVFKNELEIDPKISASQLEEFEKNLLQKTAESSTKSSNPAMTRNVGFEYLVGQAVDDITSTELEKVVMSRYQDIELPNDFNAYSFFQNLCGTYEHAFCSLVHIPGEGVWIGATPELLLSDNRERFKTTALAGTKRLNPDQPLSEIAWTQKEIEEQAFVSRYIINCFKKIRLREFHEHGPKTVKAANLVHLKTEFEVNYSEVQFDHLADQMLELLHPTSAVCGMPLEAARSFIEKNEGYDRSFYSGFLGPVHFDESIDLFVNLRCMRVTENVARLYAGAGITEDSNSEKEYAETSLKFETLLSLIKG